MVLLYLILVVNEHLTPDNAVKAEGVTEEKTKIQLHTEIVVNCDLVCIRIDSGTPYRQSFSLTSPCEPQSRILRGIGLE